MYNYCGKWCQSVQSAACVELPFLRNIIFWFCCASHWFRDWVPHACQKWKGARQHSMNQLHAPCFLFVVAKNEAPLMITCFHDHLLPGADLLPKSFVFISPKDALLPKRHCLQLFLGKRYYLRGTHDADSQDVAIRARPLVMTLLWSNSPPSFALISSPAHCSQKQWLQLVCGIRGLFLRDVSCGPRTKMVTVLEKYFLRNGGFFSSPKHCFQQFPGRPLTRSTAFSPFRVGSRSTFGLCICFCQAPGAFPGAKF